MPPPLTIPTFVLARATLSLYPADSQGNPIRSQNVWVGARQEGLRIPREIAELEDTPTGSVYDEYVQGGESSELSIERVWCQPKKELYEYDFTRGKFVMEIFDRDPVSGVWVRWTAYGCQARRYEKRSLGILYLLSDQVWRVQRWKFQSGRTGSTGEEVPVTSTAPEQALLFTHDDALVGGDYFIACYQFSTAVTVGFVKAIGQAAAEPNVLTLEIDGVLSAYTLTLPSGSGEVSDSDTLTLEVDPDQTLRWKVTSGAGAEKVGITMMIQETA